MILKIESPNKKSEIRRINLFVVFLIILIPLSDFFLENQTEKKTILYVKEFIIILFLSILLILFHSKKLTPISVCKLAIYSVFINMYVSIAIGYQTNSWKMDFETIFLKIQIITMLLIMAVGILFNFRHLMYINVINILFIACCVIWNISDYPIEKYFFYFILISGISIVGHYLHIELEFERKLEKEKDANNRIINEKSLDLQTNYNKLVVQNLRLQKTQKILRRNNVVRDKLLSIITHEVKSPLHYFIVKLGNLQKKIIPMDQMINNLREIEQASSHTYNTLERISEWIQLYKSDNKQVDTVMINNTINMVLKNYQAQLEEKKIHINNSITDNLYVKVNETMFLLVINNLIRNAIKYTEDGEISLSSNVSSQYVIIHIKDTGIGMSDNQLNQFKKTSMIANTKGSRDEKGLGIGLYLISEIIQDMGGEFTLEHNKPKGVFATVSFPFLQ